MIVFIGFYYKKISSQGLNAQCLEEISPFTPFNRTALINPCQYQSVHGESTRPPKAMVEVAIIKTDSFFFILTSLLPDAQIDHA